MPYLILVLTRSPFLDISQRILSLPGLMATRLEVKVYLLYDGVVAAKTGCVGEIEECIRKGVRFVVDAREFQARGLSKMIEGVEVLENPVSDLVDDVMKENSRVIIV